MNLTQDQKISLLEAYFANKSYVYCTQQFQLKFPNVPLPGKQTLYDLVRRFRETGSVKCRPRSGRPSVLSQEFLNTVQGNLQQSPKKSLRRLSQQLQSSYSSCQRATKRLKLRPYKVRAVKELTPGDPAKRIEYCRWFNRFCRNNVNNKLEITFFTDEAWFHLNGYINSQNSRIWATENPHALHETSLHPQKVGVWCAISRRKVVGPIFFESTINSDAYSEIIHEFIAHLEEDERMCWLQQDNATCHTSNETMALLRQFFEDRIISKGIWPPRSPDLSPCDYFLWGYLKGKVYENNPRTVQDLKNNIKRAVDEMPQSVLRRVSTSLCKRVNLCIQMDGGHFEHLL